MYPYKIMTWTIGRANIAPRLGIDLHQLWPYAPYQQMIVSLRHGADDVVIFLCLAALTLLLVGKTLELRRLALLAGLFMLPYWALMAGGVPLPASVLPAQFAEVQVKVLPVIALISLALTFFVLRGKSRLGWVLMLLLMAFLMVGHPLLEFQLDESKRNAIERAAQIGLVVYTCGLGLFAVIQRFFIQRHHTRDLGNAQNGL
jgi:hypothetical protein